MKNDGKSKILLLLAVLLVILIVLELLIIGKGTEQNTGSTDVVPSEVEEEAEQPAPQEETEDVAPEVTEQENQEEVPEEVPAEEQEADAEQEPAPEAEQPQSTGTETPGNTPVVTKPKEEKPAALKLPYTIPGTDLVIQQVNSYDGVFLEDGSDKEVTGISVIVLENQGDTGFEYANITLTQGDKKLQYKASAVPAGTTVVVQESSGAAHSSADITACSADVALLEHFEMSSSLVKVKENEDGTLDVTNVGNETIPCVRIFYKFALEKGSIYVGGITYTAKLTQLEPGATQQVSPSHYTAGSSEIMMIRTYATAD